MLILQSRGLRPLDLIINSFLVLSYTSTRISSVCCAKASTHRSRQCVRVASTRCIAPVKFNKVATPRVRQCRCECERSLFWEMQKIIATRTHFRCGQALMVGPFSSVCYRWLYRLVPFNPNTLYPKSRSTRKKLSFLVLNIMRNLKFASIELSRRYIRQIYQTPVAT